MGFYYLKSRYYDPAICRFINADGIVATGQGFLGYNMFAYCNNNPVNIIDPNGHFPIMNIVGLLDELTKRNNENNRAIDADETTTTRNRIINDQNGETGRLFHFGLFSAAWSCCEAIAIHNTRVNLGVDSTLSETIEDCFKYAVVGYGAIGSSPDKLGSVLLAEGLYYVNVDIEDVLCEGHYIISYWTGDRYSSSIHTISIINDGTNIYAYNLYGDGNTYFFDPNNYADSYIGGYMVWK